jgi:hypothetical protein
MQTADGLSVRSLQLVQFSSGNRVYPAFIVNLLGNLAAGIIRRESPARHALAPVSLISAT